ncbi:MAG: DUF6286 domain-containing protein [Frankiaceae bacterium]
MRALNRVVALLLSAALFAGGLIILVEVIRAGFHQSPVIVDWRPLVPVLTRNTWRDLGPVLVACGLVALGLVLLLLGLWRGKPVLVLAVRTPAVSVETSLLSVEHLLRQEAVGVEGVTAARVRVSRRTARVAVATPVDDVLGVEAMVRQRATGTLDTLNLVAPPAMKVRVHHVPARRAETGSPAGPTPQQSGAAGAAGAAGGAAGLARERSE